MRRGPYLAALMLIAALGIPAVVAASADGPEPLIPPGFRLHASNGYTLSAISFKDQRTGRGGLSLTMRSRHAAVSYWAPATVGSTSIEADLGVVGRIDIDFVPSGQTHTERSDCGGKSIVVDSGRYEGSIDFVGEEGIARYTPDRRQEK